MHIPYTPATKKCNQFAQQFLSFVKLEIASCRLFLLNAEWRSEREWERESWEIPLDISRILFVLSLPTASPFPHFVDWSPSGLGSSVQLLLIFNCVDFSSTQSPWNEIIYSPVKTLYHRAYSLFRQLSRAHFSCNVQIKYSPSFLLSFFVSDLPICDFLWCSSWEPAKVHLKP